MPTHNKHRRTDTRLRAVALLALAALAAAFAFAVPAQAQEGTEDDYVDLLMLYEWGQAVVVTAKSHIGL